MFSHLNPQSRSRRTGQLSPPILLLHALFAHPLLAAPEAFPFPHPEALPVPDSVYAPFSGAIYVCGQNGQEWTQNPANYLSASQCPVSCASIGYSSWCCPSSTTCQAISGGSVAVACCPSGSTCGGAAASPVSTVTVTVQQVVTTTTQQVAAAQATTKYVTPGAEVTGYCTTLTMENVGDTPKDRAGSCGRVLIVQAGAGRLGGREVWWVEMAMLLSQMAWGLWWW